jgi:cobalt-zinc-cadmium efflux system outer membrane protein
VTLLLPTLSHAQGATSSKADRPSPSESEAWTLERVVTAALSQHPLVEAARARVDAARADRVGADALPNPTGTFWVENTAFPGQSLGVPLNRETSTYMTLPLEPFIQRSSRIRRADEDLKAAQASLTSARRHVAAEAVRAFFRVALAQAMTEEAEENRDRLEQLLSYNRARVDEGVTAEGEWLRVQLELDRASTEVTFADVDLARARTELAPYLGNLGGQPNAVAFRVNVPSLPAPAPSSIPRMDVVLAAAREHRPERLGGQARIAAASATADVERTLSVRQFGATFGNKRVEGQNSMVLGVSLAVPLFNRNRSGVERAMSERLAAEQELAWTDRQVAAEVQGAHDSAMRFARRLADLQQSFLSRAEEMHRLTLGAYQEGGASLLQVLDATRLLADARLTYARTLFAQHQSLFDLALAASGEPNDSLDLLRVWSASAAATQTGATR